MDHGGFHLELDRLYEEVRLKGSSGFLIPASQSLEVGKVLRYLQLPPSYLEVATQLPFSITCLIFLSSSGSLTYQEPPWLVIVDLFTPRCLRRYRSLFVIISLKTREALELHFLPQSQAMMPALASWRYGCRLGSTSPETSAPISFLCRFLPTLLDSTQTALRAGEPRMASCDGRIVQQLSAKATTKPWTTLRASSPLISGSSE